MTSNAVLNKEAGTEKPKECCFNRILGLMEISGVKWHELYEVFGKDIKRKLMYNDITTGELYDVCNYMDADYRYVTKEREDYKYDIHDFVTDPRIKEDEASFLKEEGHAADSGKPAKTSVRKHRKMMRGTAAEREPNKIDADRLKSLLDAEGIGYNLLREFLGITIPNITQLMKVQTLPLYATENMAWFLETTPEYLTGSSGISWLGAENVTRHVMKTQTVLLNGEVLTKYRDKLHENKFLSQEMILWMTAKDSMASQEFAERIARMVGLKGKASAVTTRRCNQYDSEPSMIGTFILTSKFQEKCGVREAALESVPSDMESVSEEPVSSESIPTASDSSEPVPAGTESVQDNEHASIQDVSMFISEPISAEPVPAEETDAEPVPTDAESDSGLIPKDVLDYIEGMSDDRLELLNGYIESLKTARSFKAKLKLLQGKKTCD